MAGSYRPLAAAAPPGPESPPPAPDRTVPRSEPKPDPQSSWATVADRGGAGAVASTAPKSASPSAPAIKPRAPGLSSPKPAARFSVRSAWSAVKTRLAAWLRASLIWLWRAGLVAAIGGLTFVLVRLRKNVRTPQLSLITRSFERGGQEPAAGAMFPSTPPPQSRG
jgi:hypothetical protein